MPCYTCSHCNKCGMYSTRAAIVCVECETEIQVGQKSCPKCGCTKFKAFELPALPPTPYDYNVKPARARQ